MPKSVLFCLLVLLTLQGMAQTYPPAAGQPGSTAIHKNDGAFVAWASGISLTRGYIKLSEPGLGFVTSGVAENAVGFPTGAIVSLGDRGEAVATFNLPITNGPGFDFAVFENGNIGYLELGIVEVSSDGVNYFGFPMHSQTQVNTQIGTFETPSAPYLHNIAGKYEGTHGTPFDLSEIPDNPLLNKQHVTHVKIIDVVGSISSVYATYDSFGNAINDSYPTPFDTGGFDLQAVGVIHQQVLGTHGFGYKFFLMYPNPATGVIYFTAAAEFSVKLFDMSGRIVKSLQTGNHEKLAVSDLASGNYVMEIVNTEEKIFKNLIIR
ncbi:T9SS type A sorting domain-containing protein [Flavobacterium enshiense]|uniref:T9SS type A sorting domain-containing protein n=1 Tax=Flavobacterium enshiense TaxID=1341165 RepID=UPI00345D3B3A